jgi:hypothetical protein
MNRDEKIDELIHEYCILGLMNSSDFIQKLDKIEIDYVSQNEKLVCSHCYGTGKDHGDEDMETDCPSCK